jgi:S-DNA-T family DNA segregation ATPase FtsK/SpoIIIE
MRGLAAGYAPEEVRFIVVDYRRTLGDTVRCRTSAPTPAMPAQPARTRNSWPRYWRRVPPAGISARELQDRAWWTGPELYLVVDDYDVAEGASSPLRPQLD